MGWHGIKEYGFCGDEPIDILTMALDHLIMLWIHLFNRSPTRHELEVAWSSVLSTAEEEHSIWSKKLSAKQISWLKKQTDARPSIATPMSIVRRCSMSEENLGRCLRYQGHPGKHYYANESLKSDPSSWRFWKALQNGRTVVCFSDEDGDADNL